MFTFYILNLTGRSLGQFWKTPFGKNCSSVAFEYKNGEINMIYENKLYYDTDCPYWQQQIPSKRCLPKLTKGTSCQIKDKTSDYAAMCHNENILCFPF